MQMAHHGSQQPLPQHVSWQGGGGRPTTSLTGNAACSQIAGLALARELAGDLPGWVRSCVYIHVQLVGLE